MMEISWTDLVPLWLLCPVLIAVAWNDLSRLTIPNYLVVTGIVIFVCSLPLLDYQETFARVLAGVVCFTFCLVMFAMRWVGGGDAKMMPVVFLFVPSAWISSYIFGFAFSLIIGMTLVWAARVAFGRADAGWISLRPDAAFPMGVSIALSGLFLAGWATSFTAYDLPPL